MEGKESWRTGALDNAISQILVDIRPHNAEVWRWRFEDAFGVELDTLIKVCMFINNSHLFLQERMAGKVPAACFKRMLLFLLLLRL